LKIVGDRAVPYLMAAANENRLATSASYRPILPEIPNLNSPLYRIGELLATSGSAGAVVHFLENLTSGDPCFREYCV